MIIQIDQSGKLEKTNIPTAIGYSNSKTKAITITASEKILLEKHFRNIGKRRTYIYKSFAAIIFLLLKDEKEFDFVIIDTEYPGHEPLIKNHILNFFRTIGNDSFDKSSFVFKQVGKASSAHSVAYNAYKNNSKSVKVTAKEILSIIK